MFYQFFLSPQVKRCAITTYKHGIYELPHELPNDLRSYGIFAAGEALVPTQEKKKDLRKLGNARKVSKPHRMIAQCPVPPPK